MSSGSEDLLLSKAVFSPFLSRLFLPYLRNSTVADHVLSVESGFFVA